MRGADSTSPTSQTRQRGVRQFYFVRKICPLSRTPLRERLAFKGGTAIKRCYFGDYRFSEDLDFTLATEATFDEIRPELAPVFAEAKRATGAVFCFAREDRRTHENSHTFYLGYEGPLPAPAGGREVKVDISIRERLVFPLEDRKPRDLYDVWYLADGGHVDLADLVDAIEQKWDFRGKRLADVRGEFAAKEPRYKKLWGLRLSRQMVDLPEFNEVYRAVRRALRRSGLAAK